MYQDVQLELEDVGSYETGWSHLGAQDMLERAISVQRSLIGIGIMDP